MAVLVGLTEPQFDPLASAFSASTRSSQQFSRRLKSEEVTVVMAALSGERPTAAEVAHGAALTDTGCLPQRWRGSSSWRAAAPSKVASAANPVVLRKFQLEQQVRLLRCHRQPFVDVNGDTCVCLLACALVQRQLMRRHGGKERRSGKHLI